MEEKQSMPVADKKTHDSAIWSLILGIISCILFFFVIPIVLNGLTGRVLFLLFIPSFLALSFGVMALVKISNSPEMLKGKRMAIVGIILSGVSFALILLFIPVDFLLRR
jgi:hypothetical protein